MSVRPFRDIERKKTKVINVGDVKIGGDNPISVQSMTNTLTTDVKATINQINDIVEEGADIVRVSCPDKDSTAALKEIVNHVSVPIVADIHFHYKRAVEAAESGAKCLRINPGNIGDKVKIHEVLSAAKNNDCSVRIGVNAGSLERDILEKFKEPCPEALVDSAMYNIKLMEDSDFFNFKISVKSSDVFLTVKAYKKLSEVCDYPLHLGVTEAGGLLTGSIKSSIGIGQLLMDGIGDTIRISLSDDPVKEVKIGNEILKSLNFENYVNNIDLTNIEPFTMVIVDWNNNNLNLFELIWDDEQKQFTKLQNDPKIWSSATLYSNEIKALRKKWFQNWIKENDFNASTILEFHHSEIGDKEQSIFMKRPYVETVSITSIKKENKSLEMIYEDIVHAKKLQLKLNL